MFGHEEVRALRRAGLLVGHGGEDDVATQARLGSREEGQHARAHRHHVLHIDGPATPDAAVGHVGRKRRPGPRRFVRLDDVEMRVQKKRRKLTSARVARDETRATRFGFDDFRLDARAAQKLRDALGRGALVPRRVHGGNADEIAQEGDAGCAFLLPIDLGLHER